MSRQQKLSARHGFGSEALKRATEGCRGARDIHFLETLLQYLQYGLRTPRKALGFAVRRSRHPGEGLHKRVYKGSKLG